MSKFSTQQKHDVRSEKEEEQAKNALPKAQTLVFLRQFARAYQTEKGVAAELGGYVLN